MALQTHISLSHLLLIASLLSAAVSAATTISPGSSLSAANPTTTWSSPNDTFSLGFIPSDPPTSPPSYIAAISYSGGVPVWSVGAGKVVDSGGILQFLPSGTLRLVNGSGATLWDSNTTSRGVSSAAIDDSGNLVLRNGTVTVWSSFDNPTDSIVPGQNFTVSKVLRSGLYSFKLVKNGNRTLLWNDITVYWNQGLNSSVNTHLSSPTLGLRSIGILSISDPQLSTDAIVAYSSDYAETVDILRVLKLWSDGNLRIYSSTRGSGTVTERWAAVTDQCEVFGYCGDMGVCTYNDTDPVCGCMSLNFELVDPKDSRKGCKRKMEIKDCPQSVIMLDLEHTRFLSYPPETESQIFFFSAGILACRLNCLGSSACDASTSLSDGTGLCYSKTPGFLSGYHSPAMSSSSYIKVCGPVIPNPSSSLGTAGNKKDWKLRAWIVVVVVFATLFGLMAFEGGLWWWFCRNSRSFGGLSAQYALLEYASGAPVQFSYKELQCSTKGFKEKLGAGGFGAVYKGILANRTVVAVKQLEGIEQGEKQFRMEVATISSTHHLNLVRLIGFCSEGRHRLLVYEFMKNGSLDSFLFATDEQSGKLLNWESRFNVALGTARGITYLHEECRDCIVVSGRRNFEVSEATNRKKFSLWAFEEFEKGNIRGIVDRRLVDQDVDMDQVKRAIQVTFWCIQEQPSHRPMMGKVVQMLEGITDIETPPDPRAVIEGSAGGTSMTVSSNVSPLSTAGDSAPASSSFSSFQISGVSPPTSGRNTEKATTSLIQSDPN
ncbi:hypothetical protein C1H46_004365 [Malus baccata]|uniref:Receptor-like serine/threonine-protein kinase n=1 Tax=Malus baccata TaxID=106549 RepID=A0A540NGB3_MALBA|nr:hypothetical protein C1H46_004365 [Malus baccata]